MKYVGIIPARFGSVRFPGKPLALILGKSLIRRTYENAKKASALSDLIVATEDQRIYDHVLDFGGKAVLISSQCPKGSDAVAEAALGFPDAEIIVNIQGDEPCVEPEIIDQLAKSLENDPDAVVATAASPLRAADPMAVTCTVDLKGHALYFSRSLIPGNKGGIYHPSLPYLRHIGLYAFRRDFLLTYAALPPTPLMLVEDLEQLKVLEHGYKIRVEIVESASQGVDWHHDLQKVELLCQQNMSS